MSPRILRSITGLAIALLVLLGSTAPAQAQLDKVREKANDAMQDAPATPITKEQAETHIATLNEVHAQHYADEQPLSQMRGHGILAYSSGLEPAQDALTTYQAVEEILPEVRPIVRTFAETYGTTSRDIERSFEDLGMDVEWQVASRFKDLYQALQNYEKDRAASADMMAQNAKDVLRLADDFSPKLRMQHLSEQQEILKIAHEIAPNHAEINQLRVAVSERFAAEAEDIQQEIDAATWKGHASGAPTGLADDALTYLRADRDWGGREGEEVLAVAVRGDWQVAERDILGRVIRWRLPLHVATTNAEKRSTYDAASVYEVSLVAEQGAPGAAPKQPPFDGFWVGDNWMIRLAAVPQQ
jgi:hypothetical protein